MRTNDEIQLLALKCVLGFKAKELAPYGEKLMHVVEEDKHNLRAELLTLSLEADSGESECYLCVLVYLFVQMDVCIFVLPGLFLIGVVVLTPIFVDFFFHYDLQV
jgi:hypothetical protein